MVAEIAIQLEVAQGERSPFFGIGSVAKFGVLPGQCQIPTAHPACGLAGQHNTQSATPFLSSAGLATHLWNSGILGQTPNGLDLRAQERKRLLLYLFTARGLSVE